MIPEIIRLNIQLTKRCNQRCRSCNSYNMDISNELRMDEIKKIIKEATDLFLIKNIAFTGGEPTLFPDFCELSSYAKEKSPFVSVTTNGYYCSSKERACELIRRGVNRFSFSYHGVGTHDEFTRVKGCEERLRQAIDWLKAEKEQVYIKIGTLYTGYNIQGVERVLEYAESKDVDLYIEVFDNEIPFFSSSEISMKQQRLVDEDILEPALEKILFWKKTGRKVLIDQKGIEFIRRWYSGIPLNTECPLWNTDIYIESNGDVRTGCWILPPVGNIREKSLNEMLGSSLYQKNIEDMKMRNCNGCTCAYLAQAKLL